jgi:nucleotide-binding universal stress UspA family protein
MLPIHAILHPNDFSDRSLYAMRLAAALARDYGARLVVLNVVSDAASSFTGDMLLPGLFEEMIADARRQLDELDPGPDVSVERRLETGEPADEIVRVAREIDCDLIVMGTHGRTWLRRLLMGSVAEEVVRKSPCPVLTTALPFAPAEQAEHAVAAAAGA